MSSTAIAVVVADEARRAALRQLLRIPGARALFVNPSKRIAAGQILCVATALAASFVHPILALSLGASLLGVPHVLSGVRHLAIRRSLHPVTWVAAVVVALLGLALLLGGGGWTLQAITLCFTISVAIEIVCATPSALRRAAWLTVLCAASALALRFHGLFLVTVTHLHAVGSIAFFCIAARRRGISALPVACGAGFVALLILTGPVDPLLHSWAWHRSFGPDAVVDLLGAPFQAVSGSMLRRSLTLYAFGQSLHYMVWLRLMPEIDRPTPLPWSFRRGLQSFRRDFGGWTVPLLCLCLAGCALMIIGGHQARDAYFALAYFHIGLEVAALSRALLRPTVPVGRSNWRIAPVLDQATRRPVVDPSSMRIASPVVRSIWHHASEES